MRHLLLTPLVSVEGAVILAAWLVGHRVSDPLNCENVAAGSACRYCAAVVARRAQHR